jgi:hypothetical protein
MLKCWVVVVAFAALAIPALTGAEDIQLRFQIDKNGSSVATPVLKIAQGETGSIALGKEFRLLMTPTRTASNTVTLECELMIGDSKSSPRLVLTNETPGSISWKSPSGSDSFKMRISLIKQ